MTNFMAMTQQLQEKNCELDALSTKAENLDMYQQHLTSINVRCDLLEEQVRSNYTNDYSGSDLTHMDWIATKTTLENLRAEFKYLSKRFVESSSGFLGGLNESCNKTNCSLFSCDGTQFTDDTAIESSRNILPELLNVQPKKRVMKKESFLNISNQPLIANPNQTKHDSLVLPMKKFKICNSKSTPTTKTSIPDLKQETQRQLKGASKPKFDSINMPLIEEETTPARRHPSLTRYHQRHCSLPETASLVYTEASEQTSNHDSTLKHFISYDVDLHVVHQLDLNPLLDKPRYLSSNKRSAITKMISSSPLERFTNGDDFDITLTLDDDLETRDILAFDHDTDSGLNDDDTFSENSYGAGECQPFVLKKNSQLYLRRSKSHESIFKEVVEPQKSDIKLKEQTMKWVKPNAPSISSQSYNASKVSTSTVNARHNIVSMLNSSGLSSVAESPAKSSKTKENNSWSFLSTPTKPRSIPKSTTVDFKHVEEQLGSWISSFVPNAAFATPETGKRISTPSGRSFNQRGSWGRKLSVSVDNKPLKSPQRKRNASPQVSSSLRSGLIIERNGVIRHGNGDLGKSVVMSRVSHSALREALQYDIKG